MQARTKKECIGSDQDSVRFFTGKACEDSIDLANVERSIFIFLFERK
jgi:hypothetical protein